MYSEKELDKIESGLLACKNISECKYETKKDCPYRETNLNCGRLKLMEDAFKAIVELRQEICNLESMINSAKEALGAPNCNDCDRW